MTERESLADKIAGLLNSAPSYNPDENDTETAAKVVDYDAVEHDEDAKVIQSAFRKNNVSLLVEVDAKYAGKKSSRKDLYDSDEEDDLPLEHIDQESDSGAEEDSESTDGDDDSEEGSGNEKDQANFKHMNEANLKVINKKSQCVQNQIQMWENLLEMRIQLQKCLLASNKLPGVEVYKEMKINNEFREKSECTKDVLMGTLGNMIELQELLVKRFPESKNVLKDKGQKKNETGDEEDELDIDISTDTEDEEGNEEDVEESEDESKPPAKRKKFTPHELEQRTVKLHKNYTTFRNTTIQKWNDRTQIAHGKTANTNPVLKQIEFNLTDKPRLIRRTQLKRSEYKIIGENHQDSHDEVKAEEEEQPKTNEHDYNKNIFDDDDFYHQLLRELIEVKSADITDPVQLSRQWIQLQNLRSKMKRKIDTRATKGRRMRFGVHTKLINFMAPINNELITDEAQTELFSSLFGKRG